MQAHTAHTAYTAYGKPERHAAIPTVFNWIRQKLDARRARLNRARNIEYLRSLDHHLPEDIGVDIASLGEIMPKLASFHPHAVASAAIGRSLSPPHTNTR